MSIQKDIKRDYFQAALDKCILRTGITQTELAEKTKISQGRISEIISGKYKAGLRVQTKVAKALGYELIDFLDNGRSILENNGKVDSSEQKSSIKEILKNAPSAEHLDGDLMIDVVTTLEEFLIEQKKRLQPRAKAEIIVQLYEIMKENEEEANKPVVKFKLVTPLLSKALSLAVND